MEDLASADPRVLGGSSCGQEDRRPQAVAGPAVAGPRGPRRVPVAPGHRTPPHLRARDQPRHRRLGRGGIAARGGGDPRDQIVSDLESPGAPYWRPKTLMDAWCTLWFWPVGKAALLDGTDEAYPAGSPPETVIATSVKELPPVDPDPAFPQVWEMDSLFDETPKQLTLTPAPARRPLKPKVAVDRQRPVALKSSTTGWTSPRPCSAARTSRAWLRRTRTCPSSPTTKTSFTTRPTWTWTRGPRCASASPGSTSSRR
jgi:hypothetical protein